jgi:hypothetical protein
MHSVVLVIVPADAPDLRGMIDAILEPYRQNHDVDGKRAWPYWDYWSLYDQRRQRTTHHVHECVIPISEVLQDTYAALFSPDGELHDCNCPMPTEVYDRDSVQRDFEKLCRPVLERYMDHVGIPVRLHS